MNKYYWKIMCHVQLGTMVVKTRTTANLGVSQRHKATYRIELSLTHTVPVEYNPGGLEACGLVELYE